MHFLHLLPHPYPYLCLYPCHCPYLCPGFCPCYGHGYGVHRCLWIVHYVWYYQHYCEWWRINGESWYGRKRTTIYHSMSSMSHHTTPQHTTPHQTKAHDTTPLSSRSLGTFGDVGRSPVLFQSSRWGSRSYRAAHASGWKVVVLRCLLDLHLLMLSLMAWRVVLSTSKQYDALVSTYVTFAYINKNKN